MLIHHNMEVFNILRREAIYLWYYFDIQLRQIFRYWLLGILLGSAVSVFAKNRIHKAAELLGGKIPGIVGLIFASALGIASPLCMYGTIPICAAFSKKGVKDDFLAAFMMSSILLNPQLIVYSAALGPEILAVRIASCFLCGILAGVLVKMYCGKKNSYFDFGGFENPRDNDTDKNMFLRYLKNVLRNIRATGGWFLLGIFLSAVFQRYIPEDLITRIFGGSNAWGVLMAATVGVPIYVCGGGTIPLLLDWLANGMSAGSAAAFMITGPATKITNLGALKIALGVKNFALYVLFVMAFSFATGILVNALL
ncbi:MAG: permease [Bacteroides sp.]|nr:permease [Prevotella sp.]MCM1408250.1 permease [Treponema brennaborense]MCM1469574.1 permease [Bacteroides sp.]